MLLLITIIFIAALYMTSIAIFRSIEVLINGGDSTTLILATSILWGVFYYLVNMPQISSQYPLLG